MTKFLSYVIVNGKFIHHPGVRKPGPKVTDIRRSRSLHWKSLSCQCPLGVLLTTRWKKHPLVHRAQRIAALPLHADLFWFVFLFCFFLLIQFLLRISDAGSTTLGRTALVVCNILKKDSIESRKRESKKQR